MRTVFFLLLIISILFSITSSAQVIDSSKKYSINLPDKWKGKPKLLLKITAILTKEFPVLNDKQECLNCNAEYWINFYALPPTIFNITNIGGTNEFITSYSFMSFMDIYDRNYHIVRRIIIADTSEHKTATYWYGTGANNIKPVQNSFAEIKAATDISYSMTQADYNRNNLVSDMAKLGTLNSIADNTFNPNNIIRDKKASFIPSINYLWDEAERVILSYKL